MAECATTTQWFDGSLLRRLTAGATRAVEDTLAAPASAPERDHQVVIGPCGPITTPGGVREARITATERVSA